MAPSRGANLSQTGIRQQSEDDIAVEQQSSSALKNARRNFNYIVSRDVPKDQRPLHFRTRVILRTFRYIGQFVIWRLVRWAKYIAVGTLVAAVGATAFGSVISGVAWIAAPPTFGASILAATIWGVGKFTAKRLHKRWNSTGRDHGEADREYENDHALKRTGSLGQETGPQAIPW